MGKNVCGLPVPVYRAWTERRYENVRNKEVEVTYDVPAGYLRCISTRTTVKRYRNDQDEQYRWVEEQTMFQVIVYAC